MAYNPASIVPLASVAALEALGAASGQYPNAYVVATNTTYSWNPASTASPNGVTVIQATGVATGRWIKNAPYNIHYASWGNIFDIINPDGSGAAIVADIIANGGTYRLDVFFSKAIAIGGSWYFPAGTYNLTNTVTMAPGVEFHGAGMGNTIISPGGSAGQWGFELLNANGTNEVEGYKLYDITFELGGGINGIRWNSATGGFTNDSSSQAYMLRCHIERCQVLNDQSFPNTLIGIQMSKCFDSVVQDCSIVGLGTGVDFEGTDISRITDNRLELNSVTAILITSHSSFGSTTRIVHNDILSPGNSGSSSASALITSDRDGYFCENYIEGFATVTNTIQVTGGFTHKINDNRIEWANATNVVNFTTGFNNPYGVEFCNNHSTGAMGNIIWAANEAPYFNNSTGRNFIKVERNTALNNNVPFLSQEDSASPFYPGCVALVTAGRQGVAFTGLANNVMCNGDAFILAPNSDTSQYIEFSDWSSYPAGTILGTHTIDCIISSGIVSQVMNWQVLDGGSSVATGTITCSAANTLIDTAIVGSHAFTTKPVIRFWNQDTGHGGNVTVYSMDIRFG